MQQSDNTLYTKLVEYVTAIILGLTAVLKLVAAAQSSRYLLEPDPILLLPNRAVLLTVATVEIAIALFLIKSSDKWLKFSAHLWVVVCFSFYRIGWWIADIKEPCSCLGREAAWWPWLGNNISTISWVFFVMLVIALVMRGPLLLPSIRRSPSTDRVVRHELNPG
jgi:hypothetical protein